MTGKTNPHSSLLAHQAIATVVLLLVMFPAIAFADDAPSASDLTAEALENIDDLSLAELMEIEIPTVVGASRHEQKITEAPASVTIVPREEIRTFGYRTLADLLRNVRGFYVTSDGTYGFIGVRGFNRPGDYGGRILLLVDGHRQNDPIYESAANLMDFIIDLDLVERVEIIRGPSSSLYGNNAVFAVVNVITRKPGEFDGGEVAASAGSHSSYKGRVSAGEALSNGVSYLVSATAYDSRGDRSIYFPEFDDGETSDGVARKIDDTQSHQVYGRISYRDVTLAAAFNEHEKQVASALYGAAFDDPRYVQTDRHAFVDLSARQAWSADFETLIRAYYHHYGFEATYPYASEDATAGDGIVVNRDDQFADSLGGEIQARKQLSEQHKLVFGGEYRDDYRLQLFNYDIDPRFVYQDEDQSAANSAFYVQDEYQMLANLIINAGLRYDYYETFGDSLNPRVAAIWEAVPGTTLKMIYGTAFRAPNAYERYYVSNVNEQGESLDPEDIESYELILDQVLSSRVHASLSVFRNEISDLIGPQEDADSGVTTFANTDSATAEGAEVELQSAWADGSRARASYSFVQTEDGESGETLFNSPEHLVKGAVAMPILFGKAMLGFELQYTSSRESLEGMRLDDFWVANVNLLSEKLRKGWELSLGVYNLFDEDYLDPTDDVPDTVPQAGRTLQVKATHAF